VNFNSDVKVAGVFGNDAGQILDRQHLTPARGGTSLRDAIVLAEEWSQARHPRREIVVISDGSDNSSSESTARLRNDVKKTGIPIWAITFADPAAYPNHESEWLREIVTSTGGAEFVALDPKQIEAFATAIAK
jgi:Mg-chelatase subunit ChlD